MFFLTKYFGGRPHVAKFRPNFFISIGQIEINLFKKVGLPPSKKRGLPIKKGRLPTLLKKGGLGHT